MPDPPLAHAVAVTALILGGAVAALNFYLSFGRSHVLRWCGWEYRHASGFPLIGSLLLVPAAVYFLVEWSPRHLGAALLLTLLDTGGAVWFVPVMVREVWRDRQGDQ